MTENINQLHARILPEDLQAAGAAQELGPYLLDSYLITYFLFHCN